MHAEDYEHGMDIHFRHAEIVWKTDLYDSAQDYRSEARYDNGRPDIEPETVEPVFACIVDESAGFRG
jgi:hypothetical protein